ncbi:hypothetical protein D3C85_1705750 [compost metagenome]
MRSGNKSIRPFCILICFNPYLASALDKNLPNISARNTASDWFNIFFISTLVIFPSLKAVAKASSSAVVTDLSDKLKNSNSLPRL